MDSSKASTLARKSMSGESDISLSRSSFMSEDLYYSNEIESDNDFKDKKRKRKIKNKELQQMEPEQKYETIRQIYDDFLKKKQFDKAFEELLKFPPLARLSFGDNDWRYAVACGELAEGYIIKNYPLQSVKHSEKARDIILCGGAADRNYDGFTQTYFLLNVAQIYLTLGRAYYLSNNLKNSENALKKSWHIMVKKIDNAVNKNNIQIDDSDVQNKKIDIKEAMANTYIKLKNAEKALSCLSYVKGCIITRDGEKSKLLIKVYKNMAKAEKLKPKNERNYDAVVEYCKEAHIIASDNSGDLGDEMAESAFSLAHAYTYFDEEYALKAAETYYNEAMQLYTEVYDETHSKVLKTRDAMCKLMIRMDREDEALSQLKSLLKTKLKIHGEYSSEVAETHKFIGSILLSKGNVKDSSKHLQKCCEIEEQVYGKNHWKTKSSRETYGLVLQSPEVSSGPDSIKSRPYFNTIIRPK